MAESLPNKEQLQAEWSAAAGNWIETVGGRGDASRRGLLDDSMIQEVGDVSGLDVIDIGCGEGRFCRMLAVRGARVTGVDLCESMIRAAVDAGKPDQTDLVGDAENLSTIETARFDLAVSYVALVDVRDIDAAAREAFRVLKPGGRFVICNLAPMVTAGNMWVKDGNGEKLHFRLDNYFNETVRVMPMCGVQLSNFHRTLSTYVNSFLGAGFMLEGIREPMPNAQQIAREPSIEDMLRVPLFIIYLLRKQVA